MKAAVTAANGRLGTEIVHALIDRLGRDNVVAVARTPAKATHLGIEVRKGDYDIPEDFERAFLGIEVAVIVSSMAPPDARVGQHRNVIGGAKAAGVRKIVYNSIYGETGKCSFDVIINSNRQTELDVQQSGLQWIIGRNGLYIDADLEAIDQYKAEGGFINCAADGKVAYTSREELAAAYGCMVQDDLLNSRIYNLAGEPISQEQLAEVINQVFGTSLTYREASVAEYKANRVAAHGEFLGNIISGIYQGIREGAFAVASDFDQVCGRKHLSVLKMAQHFKDKQ